VAEWFNTSAFADPAAGHGATPATTPCADLGATKLEHLALQKLRPEAKTRGSGWSFRVESFNTWNITELNQVSKWPGSTISAKVTSAFDPRCSTRIESSTSDQPRKVAILAPLALERGERDTPFGRTTCAGGVDSLMLLRKGG